MRNIVKYILKNLIAGHITDADAIKQLQVPINTFINFSLSQKTLKPASANVKTAK